MIRVDRKPNEPFEKLLRRFKKRCEKEDLVKDMKKQEYYESKGVRRRRAKRKTEKRFEKEKIEGTSVKDDFSFWE